MGTRDVEVSAGRDVLLARGCDAEPEDPETHEPDEDADGAVEE
jgi:hypothetical protein